jgi:micrococcal nuclease
MNRKFLRLVPAISILPLALFILIGRSVCSYGQDETFLVKVSQVHDGDTVSVLIGRKREKVRLIGIDAPELGQKPWGTRAKKRLEEIVDDAGRKVTLEFDVVRRDKYGRLLAYLWTADKRLINLEMIEDGYAELFTFPPNILHAEALRKAQRLAKMKGSGIWGNNRLK